MQSILQTICTVGIFMICGQMIIHFCPGKQYEKYLRIVFSMMVLVLLYEPLEKRFSSSTQVLSDSVELEYSKWMRDDWFYREESIAEAQKKLEQYTLEEIKRQLEERDEDRLEETGEQR